MQFPVPIKLGPNCSRWQLSLLELYESERSGTRYKPRSAEAEVYLSDIQVAARYNVSRNTVWRWTRDEVAA